MVGDQRSPGTRCLASIRVSGRSPRRHPSAFFDPCRWFFCRRLPSSIINRRLVAQAPRVRTRRPTSQKSTRSANRTSCHLGATHRTGQRLDVHRPVPHLSYASDLEERMCTRLAYFFDSPVKLILIHLVGTLPSSLASPPKVSPSSSSSLPSSATPSTSPRSSSTP